MCEDILRTLLKESCSIFHRFPYRNRILKKINDTSKSVCQILSPFPLSVQNTNTFLASEVRILASKADVPVEVQMVHIWRLDIQLSDKKQKDASQEM